jgi:hemerythrin
MGWSDKLLTGIEEIDEQHKALFEVINRLDHAVSSEDKWSAVHFALVELDNYVRVHFAVEEALMRLHGYPDLADHIAAHRGFASQLMEIKEHSIRRDVSDEMTRLLHNWLVGHIHKADKAYVPHLRTAPIVLAP